MSRALRSGKVDLDDPTRRWLQVTAPLGGAACAYLGFVAYDFGRTQEFGWSWITTLRFALWSPILFVPIIAITVGIQDWGLRLIDRRRTRRWDAGCCPSCVYPLARVGNGLCPECGWSAQKLDGVSARMLGHSLVRIAAACIVGAYAGAMTVELVMSWDELRFRREVDRLPLASAGVRPPHSRNRAWPFEDSMLVWNPATGFHGTD
jgi:hypothetical protein